MNEINATLHHSTDGLETRFSTAQDQLDDTTGKIAQLAQKQDSMQAYVDILKGIAQKHSQQLRTISDKVTVLTARSMERNVTIPGITGDASDKNPKEKVLKFLRHVLGIPVEDHEVLVTHRIGLLAPNKSRVMVVRCTPDLKKLTLSNTKNLKGKKNDQGKMYYVNKQLPDKMVEQQRKIREQISAQKEKDKHLPKESKAAMKVRKGIVHINNEPVKSHITPPMPMEIFPSNPNQKDIDSTELYSSNTHSVKRQPIHCICS